MGTVVKYVTAAAAAAPAAAAAAAAAIQLRFHGLQQFVLKISKTSLTTTECPGFLLIFSNIVRSLLQPQRDSLHRHHHHRLLRHG